MMRYLCQVPSDLNFLHSRDDCFAACKLSMRRDVARLCTVYWLALVPFICSLRFEIVVYADRRLSKSAKAFSIAST